METMRKSSFPFLLCAISLIFACGFACCSEAAPKNVSFDNLSGFLIALTKTPPVVRLRTGSGEKTFPWDADTKFLDAQGNDVNIIDFYKKYKQQGVLLLFGESVLVQMQPASF